VEECPVAAPAGSRGNLRKRQKPGADGREKFPIPKKRKHLFPKKTEKDRTTSPKYGWRGREGQVKLEKKGGGKGVPHSLLERKERREGPTGIGQRGTKQSEKTPKKRKGRRKRGPPLPLKDRN